MTFAELVEKLKTLTPEQLKTEVCCFETKMEFWVDDMEFDGEHPILTGTADLGFLPEKHKAKAGQRAPKKKARGK